MTNVYVSVVIYRRSTDSRIAALEQTLCFRDRIDEYIEFYRHSLQRQFPGWCVSVERLTRDRYDEMLLAESVKRLGSML